MSEVTGTDPATPCVWCGEPLNPEYPTFTRTIHPKCADTRALAYVTAGRPWKTAGSAGNGDGEDTGSPAAAAEPKGIRRRNPWPAEPGAGT